MRCKIISRVNILLTVFTFESKFKSGGRNRLLCRPPVNVRDEPTIAPMFYRFLPCGSSSGLGHSPFSFHTNPVTSLSIHCNVCNRHLGRTTIRHPGVGLGNQLRPRKRRTRLDLDQLLQWNGTGMVYADTLQPANQNPDQ
ncbi:hypothetical protein V6N12_051410 [Hibiscus sabdariffa]|uniref:Uncharacterized protein n=1 Tax=Hibiscus sabdariffa TaxID=183260 RepID=A0ABR2GF63_9ROSI